MTVDVNPGVEASHWDTLSKYREMFNSISEHVAPELILEKPRVGKRKGALVLDGGPFIKFTTPFELRTSGGKVLQRSKATLFTWTSKMSCASFSIPAGPINRHGTCPASVESAVIKAGEYRKFHQSIEHRKTFAWSEKGRREAEQFRSRLAPLENPDPTGQYICNLCYAGKGNYIVYKTVSLNQMAHFKWAWMTLQMDVDGGEIDLGEIGKANIRELEEAVKGSVFVEEMTRALEFIQDPGIKEVLLRKLVSTEYFRIHDAGDFFHPWYFLGWLEICRRMPSIQFWSPTRIWVYKNWQDLFKKVKIPGNLALRPSGLVVSMLPPKIATLDAGTTSYPDGVAPPGAIKDCPAYKSDDGEHSCARANCRTCWDEKDTEVSYRTH